MEGSQQERRWVDTLVDQGWIPLPLLRLAVRSLLRRRRAALYRGGYAEQTEAEESWMAVLRHSPIVVAPELANREHYEVTPDFFRLVLGPHWKYSSALWADSEGVDELGSAEERMLALVCDRAEIADGQTIMDLGCGWGSFALYAARRYPHARIVAVSNAEAQIGVVRARAKAHGLENIVAVQANVGAPDWKPPARFDRIVSVEFFEHVRNYAALLGRLAEGLKSDGRLFVHHFAHRDRSYPFVNEGSSDWMARWFFGDGQMPAARLLLSFQDDLLVRRRWVVDGRHYARTARAWRARLERERREIEAAFGGAKEGRAWYHRWRLFFLSCEELFGSRGGNEWGVVHTLLSHRG